MASFKEKLHLLKVNEDNTYSLLKSRNALSCKFNGMGKTPKEMKFHKKFYLFKYYFFYFLK